ncbi:hypothetical protein HDU76_000034 [Blyttiomyces sp. JEL0837]|nr:hypothetical protein HDU76_000034 [Blyttiomyces sp. JEL0837]
MESVGVNIEEKVQKAETPELKEQALFQWLYSVERDLLKNASRKEVIVGSQTTLEKLLIKFLTTASPKPSRPIRRMIARIFVLIYTDGETRSLFDTLAAIQGHLSQRRLDDLTLKIAGIHCLGVMTEHVGGKIMSLFSETISILVKTLRAAKEAEVGLRVLSSFEALTFHQVNLRFETLTAMARSLKAGGKVLTEAVLKDLVKIAKAGMADKSVVIRASSAELFENIFRFTNYQRPHKLDEFDGLIVLIVKAFEGSNYTSRRALSRFGGLVLASSQLPAPETKTAIKKPVKPVAAQDNATLLENTILTIPEMFGLLLSHLIKTTVKEVKIGIAESYGAAIQELGMKFLENHYSSTVKHILELISHPKLAMTDQDIYFIRETGTYLIRDVVAKMLPEANQMAALKHLVETELKGLLTGKDTNASASIVFVLNEIAELMLDLSSASANVEHNILDELFELLSHNSSDVNLALAWCLKCFCSTQPRNLNKVVERLISTLQKDLAGLNADKSETHQKCLSSCNALSAVLSVASKNSLQFSFDLSATSFGISTQLLKNASSAKDIRVSTIQTQAGWTIIGALMSLGPNFARVHMSQLLLLWKNVFPKPTGKDTSSTTDNEWISALTTRNAALVALHSCLHYNGELVTIDVAKRIVVSLNNIISFLTTLPQGTSSTAGQPQVVPPSRKKIKELELTLKRRLFKCFTLIKPISSFQTSYAQLLKMSILTFAPEPDTSLDKLPESQRKLLAASEYFHVNSYITDELLLANSGEVRSGLSLIAPRNSDVKRMEVQVDPVFVQFLKENDVSYLFIDRETESHKSTTATSRPAFKYLLVDAIDSAIDIFAMIFPLQSAEVQESVLESLIKYVKNHGSKAASGKALANQINIITAIVRSLKSVALKHGQIGSERVPVAIRDLVEDSLQSTNSLLRGLSAETLGLVSRVVSTGSFVNILVQNLVDQIISNRDPECRAGFVLAMGCIHGYSGGMAVGSHLKTTVSILHSLSSDSHPLVHTYALHSLWLTVESAGLMFGSFVNSTLMLMTKLMTSDAHDIAAWPVTSIGNDMVLPLLGKILHALVGVLGPELQVLSQARDSCFSFFEELKADTDPFVIVEAIGCIQQFINFATKYVDVPTLMPFLQNQLTGDNKYQIFLTRKAAITCLYQLTQRDPGLVLAATNRNLEEQLFALLDVEPDPVIRDEIKDILISLLRHVCPTNPSRWIDLCKGILAKGGFTTSANAPAATATRLEDDDDDKDGEAADAAPSKVDPKQHSTTQAFIVSLIPRWQTQTFALSCLRKVLAVAINSGIPEHVNFALAREKTAANPAHCDYLVMRIAELIRLSFNSSTSTIDNLRLEGLLLLQDVLMIFATMPDPDFEGHALLELYQAQISSALMPSFEADSSPHVISLACRVAASYAGSGINQDLGSLTRIIKVLSKLLDFCKQDTWSFSHPLCYNEKVMVKLAILSAWGQLHLNSQKITVLQTIVQPNLALLADQWISVLRDYAKVRLDLDTTIEDGSSSGGNSNLYVAATKEILSPYYRSSWLVLLQAFASLIESNSDIVITIKKKFYDESVGFSKLPHTLMSLCVDGIVNNANRGSSNMSANGQRGPTDQLRVDGAMAPETNTTVLCLACLKCLLRPTFLKPEALYKGVLMDLMNVFERIAQTEDVPTQTLLVEIAHSIIVNYGDVFLLQEDEEVAQVTASMESLNAGIAANTLSFIPTTSKMYSVMKLLLNIFIYHVPSLANNPTTAVTAYRPITPDSIRLLAASLDAITAFVTSKSIMEQYGVYIVPIVLYIFLVMLETQKFSTDIAPRVLVSLKSVVEGAEAQASENEILSSALQSLVTSLLDDAIDAYDEELGAASLPNARSFILAVALVLTSAPKLSFNEDNQERFVKFLFDLLRVDSAETSVLALQCLKSLMAAGAKETSAITVSYVRLIVPQLVAFTVKSKIVATPSGYGKVADEIIRSLLVLFTGDAAQRKDVMILMVSILVNFLGENESTMNEFNQTLHGTSARSLLQLATHQNSNFKEALASLAPERKVLLERAFKSLMASSAPGTGSESRSNESLNSSGMDSATAGPPKIKLMSFASS